MLIFYIIDGQIVPDYYSECLFTEIDVSPASERNLINPHKRAMYSWIFYDNYIKHVFKELAHDSKVIPRGRVAKLAHDMAGIHIDKCFFNDEKMIQQIIEVYRLPDNVMVMMSNKHRCVDCEIPVLNGSYRIRNPQIA